MPKFVYTEEFRRTAAELVAGGMSQKQVWADMGCSKSALRSRHPIHLLGLRRKICQAGLMPSFGTVGDGLDNTMMESFWSSMQIELLNRQRWKTRIELANALFDYIEIFHDRKRRHSGLGYLNPADFELRSTVTTLNASALHRRR